MPAGPERLGNRSAQRGRCIFSFRTGRIVSRGSARAFQLRARCVNLTRRQPGLAFPAPVAVGARWHNAAERALCASEESDSDTRKLSLRRCALRDSGAA